MQLTIFTLFEYSVKLHDMDTLREIYNVIDVDEEKGWFDCCVQ